MLLSYEFKYWKTPGSILIFQYAGIRITWSAWKLKNMCITVLTNEVVRMSFNISVKTIKWYQTVSSWNKAELNNILTAYVWTKYRESSCTFKERHLLPFRIPHFVVLKNIHLHRKVYYYLHFSSRNSWLLSCLCRYRNGTI